MIVVFGSVNIDLVSKVERFPHPGETIAGADHVVAAGGKGANQALAARRMGAEVAFIGAVGTDSFADLALAHLHADGVHLDRVVTVDGVSGTAFITVDAAGENQIVLSPGANAHVRASALEDVVAGPGDSLIVQGEVSMTETEKALVWAKGRGLTRIFNLAPARPVSARLLSLVDILIVNEEELRQVAQRSGVHGGASDVVETLAADLGLGVVVTLGAQGAMAQVEGQAARCPGFPVDPVDTTGAGDAFVGAFVAALDAGLRLEIAVRQGCAAGALACLKQGAQPSLPTRAAVDAFLDKQELV
ncbi:ribokinase [Chelatococcus asaccharovorans]|uniref:Ribokinase n=1 Tax=Chelatococcus asaccharovorans TaxID=28210 RepID=A0A2V3TY20_9HYPH|nr:ribokinase [Chelatococcus asaccharovorans]MBS7704781.1 ribokinase [Chelatococcus asaccharovorans]PXW54679.1 ribokinase [Chelatococcus asaccharovorans]